MNNQELAKTLLGEYGDILAAISKVVTQGNLAALSEAQRLQYYTAFCESVGLNPITRPIEFIELGSGKEKKLTLYANKSCTEQLRQIHGISCDKVEHKKEDGLYFVTAHVVDKTGRVDTATAVIPFVEPPTLKTWNTQKGAYDFKQNPNVGKPIQPNDLAILIMKTETKAKRRATLSISGLGILDETEIESIPLEKNITPAEQPKLEDYKIKSETDKEEFANKELCLAICDLSEKLQKEPGYVEKVIKMKLGHADYSKIPKSFAEEWIKNMQKRYDENQKFVAEMGEDA